jgi:DNA polymerase
MGIRDDIAGDWHASLAALAWHVEIGVDEVISEAPVNRYDLPETTRAPAAVAPAPAPAPGGDVVIVEHEQSRPTW